MTTTQTRSGGEQESIATPRQRRAHQVEAGEVVAVGPSALTDVLAEALRKSGPVERVTHGFHAYPAGLHPDAARTLLTLGEGPVLDPFCGGGTVLVEALLAGRDALGLDVSPVATLVARARTALTSEAERTTLRSVARKVSEGAKSPPPPPVLPSPLPEWYAPHVAAELAVIRDGIGNDPLLRAVFSSILVKVSDRASETSRARLPVERAPGSTAILFHGKSREYGRMLEALAAAVPEGVRARVHREDATTFRGKESFGMVLTSPPYPGVYDYLPMQLLRCRWLGFEVEKALGEEIGARRAFQADRSGARAEWTRATGRWVKSAAKALLPGGRMVVVIGDGWSGDRPVEVLPPLLGATREHGLRLLAHATVERWDAGIEALRPEHAVLVERG